MKTRPAAGDEPKNKGELMEQNQDGLEYSEEEEEMDIHEANEKLAQKGERCSQGRPRWYNSANCHKTLF